MPVTFLIIGAMKAGTSTLREHLATHPEVSIPRTEPHFFVSELNWHRGISWYRGLFDAERSQRGECSTSYSKRTDFAGVPERIHATVPSVKLVYLVRDPVARMLSQYRHNVASGRERRDATAAFSDLDDNGYLEASRYHFQLTAYLEFFPLDSILILSMEELEQDPVATMRAMYRYLGIDETHRAPDLGRAFHSGAAKRQPTGITRALSRAPGGRVVRRVLGPLLERPVPRPRLAPVQHERLLDRLRPDVDAFTALTGRGFPDWDLGAER